MSEHRAITTANPDASHRRTIAKRPRSSAWPRGWGALCLGVSLFAGTLKAEERGVYVGAHLYAARDTANGDSDISGGVSLGFNLNQHFAVEASYKKTHLDPAVSFPRGSGGIQGVELAVRGSHAVNPWLTLSAKAGAYQWRSTDEVQLGPERGTDAVVGAGVQFRVSDHVALTTEYERILGFDAMGDDDRIALGVRFDFD